MIKFFDIEIGDNVVAPYAKFKMPQKKGDVQLCDLASILNWIINGFLSFYLHNRGTGIVSPKTSAKAEKGVHADVIGECTIGKLDGDNQMRMNNFQSRAYGFLKRYVAGSMTKTELDTIVSVRVEKEFLIGYQELDAAEGHTPKERISNPDFAYGSYLAEIFTSLGADRTDVLGSKRWTVLTSILYNLSQGEDSWYWPDVYRLRNIAARYINDLAGGSEIQVTKANRKRLENAIRFWYDLIAMLGIEAGSANIKKIKTSAGFFGWVLCDRLLATPRLLSNHKRTAKKILRKQDKILPACQELCRGNAITMRRFNDDLDKWLKEKDENDDELYEENTVHVIRNGKVI